MIKVHFTLVANNKACIHVGNVDERIKGAKHEGGGRCVLQVPVTEGVKLPAEMADNTVIQRAELRETGIKQPFTPGRHTKGSVEIEVTSSGGSRTVSIKGKSFADILLAWRDLNTGTFKPDQAYKSR